MKRVPDQFSATLPNEQQVRLLDEDTAARYCGCSRSWLRQLRQRGSSDRVKAPEYVKLGRRVLYDRAALDRWIDAHRVAR